MKSSEQDRHFIKDRPAVYYEKFLSKLPPGRLLDFGCARGELVYHARLKGREAYGVEISDYCIEYAKNNYGIELFKEIPAYIFDVITVNSVLQYVPDPLKTLKSLHSHLSDGGTLYIEATNDNSLALRILRLFKPGYMTPFQRHRLFPQALKDLLKKTGFKIETFKVSGFTGGGNLKRFNPVWKALIFAGGAIGMGHIIYCTAKK